jgi:rubrerythrin
MSTAEEYHEQRIESFHARKKRITNRYFVPGMALVLVSIALLIAAADPWFVGLPLLTGVVLIAIGGSQFRCPACNRVLADLEGLIVNPKNCPNCGLSLK